jgi:hypothetical protein
LHPLRSTRWWPVLSLRCGCSSLLLCSPMAHSTQRVAHAVSDCHGITWVTHLAAQPSGLHNSLDLLCWWAAWPASSSLQRQSARQWLQPAHGGCGLQCWSGCSSRLIKRERITVAVQNTNCACIHGAPVTGFTCVTRLLDLLTSPSYMQMIKQNKSVTQNGQIQHQCVNQMIVTRAINGIPQHDCNANASELLMLLLDCSPTHVKGGRLVCA